MNLLTDFLRASTVILVAGAVMAPCGNAQSRDRRRENDPPNLKQLEARASEAEKSLVEEYNQIAGEYYKQGEKEKALDMLARLQKLAPRMPGLKEEMKRISEELMQANGMEMEIDTSKSWGLPVAVVEEGRPFRIASLGDYKIDYKATITMEGLKSEDPNTDMIQEAPFGALIGVIVDGGEIGKPFAVRSGLEVHPKKSGQLFLRVNVPGGARCNGKIKVALSGNVAPVGRRR